MDAFLDELRKLVPGGEVQQKLLEQVLQQVDPAAWSEKSLELIRKELPEPVPIDMLADWMYSSTSVAAGAAHLQQAKAMRKAVEAMRQSMPLDLDPTRQAWKTYAGNALEAVLEVDKDLGESPVRLVDARFIMFLERSGGKLERRQDLPEEAFISLQKLKCLPACQVFEHTCLPIASISHTWHQPDHPDPKGFNLRILARFIEALYETNSIQHGGTLALFMDFLSLFQKGPAMEARSQTEQILFNKALYSGLQWYAHPSLFTLKLSQMPEGYPDGFKFPADTTINIASYFDRGWCFAESSVSNLVRHNVQVFDLGALSDAMQPHERPQDIMMECTTDRDPPLTPDDFRDVLARKSFTSKKVDQPSWLTCTAALSKSKCMLPKN